MCIALGGNDANYCDPQLLLPRHFSYAWKSVGKTHHALILSSTTTMHKDLAIDNYGYIINYQPSIAAMVINNIIKEVIKWRSCVHPVGAPWAIATLGVDFPVK